MPLLVSYSLIQALLNRHTELIQHKSKQAEKGKNKSIIKTIRSTIKEQEMKCFWFFKKYFTYLLKRE